MRRVIMIDLLSLAGVRRHPVISLFHGPDAGQLTSAISGGALSARRLLSQASGTCLQFLQAA
jgi:hypothetical protein